MGEYARYHVSGRLILTAFVERVVDGTALGLQQAGVRQTATAHIFSGRLISGKDLKASLKARIFIKPCVARGSIAQKNSFAEAYAPIRSIGSGENVRRWGSVLKAGEITNFVWLADKRPTKEGCRATSGAQRRTASARLITAEFFMCSIVVE